MNVIVECPFCENQSEVQLGPSSSNVKCDFCKNKFVVKDNRLPESEVKMAVVLSPSKTQPPPMARPVNSPPPVAKVVTDASASPAPPVADSGAPNPSSDSIQTGISKSVRTRALLKRKRSPILPIIMGIAVVASAIALAIVLGNLGSDKNETAKNKSADSKAAEGSTSKSDDSSPAPSTDPKGSSQKSDPNSKKNGKDGDGVFRTDGPSDKVVAPPTNASPDKPPRMGRLSYFNSSEIEDFWRKNHSYIVRLKVDMGSSSHYVCGTVVDRRGWVVTSLSGVKNAKEIVIQNAAEDLQTFGGVQLKPIDSIRGVLAKDPAHDLVILSINRELVRNLSEIKIGNTKLLVGGLHLIECAAPGTQNKAWPNEVRFSRRQKFDNLEFDFKTQIEDAKFNRDLDYIIHNGYTDGCIGAPLLTAKGELMGINSAINDKSTNVLVIPGEAIDALMTSVTGETEDVSTLR